LTQHRDIFDVPKRIVVLVTLAVGALTVGPSRVQTRPAPEQTLTSAEIVPVELAAIQRPDAPNARGGWSILIATRDGVSSNVTSNLTITSAGSVTCNGEVTGCRTTIDLSEVSTLSQLVALSWPTFNEPTMSVCSDCLRTFLLITQRDDAGQQHIRVAFWDVTTQARVPPNIYRLFSSITTSVRRLR
jgi:hypothetical protein